MATAGKNNKKIIFIIYGVIALVAYFAMPMLLSSLPNEQRELVSHINVAGIPNERNIVSEYEIVSFKSGANTESEKYLVCSIDDDPDGTNAYGIYDPTDLAVTVRNLVRLDIKHLFLGTHIHWPDLPAVENNTLGSQLELLDSCIISTPLRRSAQANEIPQYLFDSSLPLEAGKEIAHLLPIVNGLSLAPTLDVPKNCMVGFSQLESEPTSSNIPLLAVWGDRVILSSLLLERMHQLSVSLVDLEISASHIKLGNSGNVIPINEFGYFISSQTPIDTKADIISAEITSVEKSPVDTNIAVLTSSGSQADSYRAIERPLEQLSQLALTPIMEDRVNYQRIPWWSELLVAIIIGFLLSYFASSSIMAFGIGTIVIASALYLGSFGLHGAVEYFMPILHLLIALVVCLIVRPFLKKGEVTQSIEQRTEEAPQIENPQKLMTLAEKMRAEESRENAVPEEIKMLVEQLEDKVQRDDLEESFDGDFCDLDVPKISDSKKVKKPNSNHKKI